MTAAYVTDFTNLGKYIKAHISLETERSSLTTIANEMAGILDDNANETEALKSILAVLRGLDASLVSYKAQIVSAAKKDIVQTMLAPNVSFTGSSKNVIDILEKLAADMLGTDTINGSAVAANAVSYLAANTGTFSIVIASPSQLVATEDFEVEALSTTRCKVTGEPSLHGALPTQLVAGANSVLDANSQVLFTITLTIYTAGTGYEIAGDTNSEIGATTWTGAVKGTNTDAQGDVFLVLSRLSAAESGDGDNQLTDWTNITGVELCKNTDIDGKLWVNIVDDTGGYYHVDIYKATAKGAGNLVGHTATYNSTGAKAIVADNTSGLGGTITVGAVTAADTDITYTVAFDKVLVYKETGLSNIVAAGGKVAGGATNLYAQNSSGLSGTAAITYNDGEAKVQVRVGFAMAAGDRARFDTTNDDAGKFAKFFRQELGVAVPVDLAAGETIADSLCE